MSDQQQNGTPKSPQIPEGAMYLLVCLEPKSGKYSLIYSTLTDGLALHSMADTSLEKLKRDAIAPEVTAVVPQFNTPMLPHLRNLRGRTS